MATPAMQSAYGANAVRGAANGVYARATRARWATVQIEVEGATYVGRLYVADGKKRVSEVLNDDRDFINLAEVAMNDAATVEPFVAINKRFVRTLRVINEGQADVVSIGALRSR
jgi:hypothetical protein